VNSENRVAHSPDAILFLLCAQSSETKSYAAKAAPEEEPSSTKKVRTSNEMANPRQLTFLPPTIIFAQLSKYELLHDFSKFNPYPTKFEKRGELLPSLRLALKKTKVWVDYPGCEHYNENDDYSEQDICSRNDRRNQETGSSPESTDRGETDSDSVMDPPNDLHW